MKDACQEIQAHAAYAHTHTHTQKHIHTHVYTFVYTHYIYIYIWYILVIYVRCTLLDKIWLHEIYQKIGIKRREKKMHLCNLFKLTIGILTIIFIEKCISSSKKRNNRNILKFFCVTKRSRKKIVQQIISFISLLTQNGVYIKKQWYKYYRRISILG